MKRLKKFFKEHKSWIPIFVVIFILIYAMCTSNMYAQDEYNYSNITWTTQRIESLRDLVTSLKLIYFNWSGRIIALGLSQLFLYLGIQYYDILNSIVFVVFIYMLGKVTGKKNSTIGILLALWLVSTQINEFWQKFIWEAGSFNYLWPVAFMLVVMFYFYNIIVNNKKNSTIENIIFYLFCFCAGLSHENTAFVTGMFIIVIILVNIKKLLKLNLREKLNIIIPVILFGIGAMILIFAPGNFSRLGESDTSILYTHILNNFLEIKILILIFIITSIITFFFCKKESRMVVKNNLIYFILPMICALVPMLIIHDFPERAMLAYEACIIIAILNNVFELEELIIEKRKLKIVIITFLFIISFSPLMYKAWFAKKYIEPYKEKMIFQLNYCKMAGMDSAVIEQFDKLEKAQNLNIYMDMFPKISDISIINEYISRYYGFKSVTALPKDCIMIEIDITDENEIIPYNLINKNTNEIYTTRILATELQMPTLTYKNRICFIIQESELSNIKLDIPDDIANKVVSAEIRSIGNIEKINIENLLK